MLLSVNEKKKKLNPAARHIYLFFCVTEDYCQEKEREGEKRGTIIERLEPNVQQYIVTHSEKTKHILLVSFSYTKGRATLSRRKSSVRTIFIYV